VQRTAPAIPYSILSFKQGETIMSNLRVFDPALNDTIESMFKRFLTPMRLDMENGNNEMRVDITESDGHYKVRADLPGVKKEDVNVRVDGNIVQIDAEVKKEKETKDAEGKVVGGRKNNIYLRN